MKSCTRQITDTSKAHGLGPCLVLGALALGLFSTKGVAPAHASGGESERFECAFGDTMPAVTFNDSEGVVLWLGPEQFPMAVAEATAERQTYDLILGANHWFVDRMGPDVVLLRRNVSTPVPCRRDATVHTASQGMVSAMGNFSLGGNVRSGPGTNYDDIDSLPFGEPVALIARTGIQMDGYEWFQIEYSEGLRGYQWGGIMCSNTLHVVGLYDPCPQELSR